MTSVLPLSWTDPVPLSEKAHAEMPATVAVPFTDIGTEVPFSCPAALPAMFTPPAHVAENVPEIEFAVCVEI
jgi:hypothetical protein